MVDEAASEPSIIPTDAERETTFAKIGYESPGTTGILK